MTTTTTSTTTQWSVCTVLTTGRVLCRGLTNRGRDPRRSLAPLLVLRRRSALFSRARCHPTMLVHTLPFFSPPNPTTTYSSWVPTRYGVESSVATPPRVRARKRERERPRGKKKPPSLFSSLCRSIVPLCARPFARSHVPRALMRGTSIRRRA